jgi:putative pyruvate formate lyase activating enzyme
MPEDVAGTQEIMRFLAEELSPDTYVNIMDQYHPAGKVSDQKYGEINRRLSSGELQRAQLAAEEARLWRFDRRHPSRFFVR